MVWVVNALLIVPLKLLESVDACNIAIDAYIYR